MLRWPPKEDDYVRCNVIVAPFIFEPVPGEPNKCKATRFANIDPAGNIPTPVVNYNAGTIIEFARKIVANMKK